MATSTALSTALSLAPSVIELISTGLSHLRSRKGGARSYKAAPGEPQPGVPKMLDSGSALGKSLCVYPVLLYLDLPLSTGSLNFALAAGAVAVAFGLNPRTFIKNWSTRFQLVFQEYCLVGARILIRNSTRGSGATDGGVTCFYLDESTGAAPTASEAQAHPRVELINTGVESGSRQVAHFSWVAKNYTELSWSATAVDTNSVYLKAYSDVANIGTPAACTQQWYGSATFRVAFRGLLT